MSRRSPAPPASRATRGPAGRCCSSAATTNRAKGMAVLLGALPALTKRFPDVEILIVGRGDEDELRSEAGELAQHLRFLGQVDDAEKASALRSADVYCAPNTGGESFGIVLVEAMAAAHPGGGQRPRRVPPRPGRRCRGAPGAGRGFRRAGRGADRHAVRRRGAATLRPGRRRGGAALRLAGGGRPDHARLRDSGGGGRQGARCRDRRQERSDPGARTGRSEATRGTRTGRSDATREIT